MKRKMFPVAAAALVFGLASVGTTAAVDMFLEIGDIQGESLDSKFTGSIDVLAWSWGASSGFDGRGKGNISPCIQDLSVTKYIDSASGELMMGLMTGMEYEEAKLTVRKAGGAQLEYIVIDFSDVRVSSVSTGGSGGEDRLTENISLNFDSAEFIYTKQDDTGGEAGKITAILEGSTGACR